MNSSDRAVIDALPPTTEAEDQAFRDALADRLVVDEFGEPKLLPAETPKHSNQDTIDGLRALADFIEKHPQRLTGGMQLNLFGQSKEQIVEAVRGLGKVEKRAAGEWFYFTKDFGGGVSVDWNVSRDEVCERVVVGTKVIPAKPAEPERLEEIIEWVCPKSLLSSVNP